MSMLTKVYNKGIRPIVYLRTLRGVKCIHPGKFDLFSKIRADEIIKKFPDACSGKDWNTVLETRKREAEEARKKAKAEADKKKKAGAQAD